jgi:hypothetical protein
MIYKQLVPVLYGMSTAAATFNQENIKVLLIEL